MWVTDVASNTLVDTTGETNILASPPDWERTATGGEVCTVMRVVGYLGFNWGQAAPQTAFEQYFLRAVVHTLDEDSAGVSPAAEGTYGDEKVMWSWAGAMVDDGSAAGARMYGMAGLASIAIDAKSRRRITDGDDVCLSVSASHVGTTFGVIRYSWTLRTLLMIR